MKLSTGLCFPSDDGVGRSHEGHSSSFLVALPVTCVAWDSFALHAIHKGTVAFPFHLQRSGLCILLLTSSFRSSDETRTLWKANVPWSLRQYNYAKVGLLPHL